MAPTSKRRARSSQPAKRQPVLRRPADADGYAARLIARLSSVPFVALGVADGKTCRWIRVNARMCALLGYARRELEGASILDLCSPNDRGTCMKTFARLLAGERVDESVDHRLVRKDGSVLDARAHLSVVKRRPRGAPLLVALLEDVTEKRAAERQVAQVEARYRQMFEGGALPMVLLDPEDGRIVEANPAAQAMYGWTPEQLKAQSKRISEFSLTDPAMLSARLRTASTQTLSITTARHRVASGDWRDVELSTGPIELDGRGYVFTIVRDVTEQLGAERARREAEEQLRALVEQNVVGIYMIRDERFVYVNPQFSSIFGYASDELVGAPVVQVVAPESRPLVLANVRRRVNREVSTLHYEFRGLRKDGTVIDVGAHGTIAVVKGRPTVMGALQDITERLRARELERAHLQRLERTLRGAVSTVAHMVELRDPYTSGHEQRVGELAAAIGAELGLDADRVEGLRMAGYLHDVGKISVPAEILSKPSRLTLPEFELVKTHTAHGYAVLRNLDFPWPVAEVAYQHHERLDGTGYPQGLRGEQILPEARIVAVADVVEAMSSHRPYRPAIGARIALGEIDAHIGTRYDRAAAEACIRLVEKGLFEFGE